MKNKLIIYKFHIFRSIMCYYHTLIYKIFKLF